MLGAGDAAAESPLTGRWQCQNRRGGAMNEQLVLEPNGTFRSEARGALGTSTVWGRWAQQGSTLTLWPVGYNPPDLNLPEKTDAPFKMPKPDRLEVGASVCQRTR